MVGGDNEAQTNAAQDIEPDQEILGTELQKDAGGERETK